MQCDPTIENFPIDLFSCRKRILNTEISQEPETYSILIKTKYYSTTIEQKHQQKIKLGLYLHCRKPLRLK